MDEKIKLLASTIIAIFKNLTVTVTKTGVNGSVISLPFSVISQSVAQLPNFVKTNNLLIATSDTLRVKSMGADSVNRSIVYFDGLGRQVQNVGVQASPLYQDIVQISTSDQYGRQVLNYQPLTFSNGIYNNIYSNGTTDKIVDDPTPFSQIVYEESPLNRPLKQGEPGAVMLRKGL